MAKEWILNSAMNRFPNTARDRTPEGINTCPTNRSSGCGEAHAADLMYIKPQKQNPC